MYIDPVAGSEVGAGGGTESSAVCDIVPVYVGDNVLIKAFLIALLSLIEEEPTSNATLTPAGASNFTKFL